MVFEVLQFISHVEFMRKQTKPRAFLPLESKRWTNTIDVKVNSVNTSTLLKNIKLFSGFEFQMTARIAQHKSADHAILSVQENLHTIEQLGSYVPFLKIFPKCLNKVYESSASTFAMNDQLKGSKWKRRSG